MATCFYCNTVVSDNPFNLKDKYMVAGGLGKGQVYVCKSCARQAGVDSVFKSMYVTAKAIKNELDRKRSIQKASTYSNSPCEKSDSELAFEAFGKQYGYRCQIIKRISIKTDHLFSLNHSDDYRAAFLLKLRNMIVTGADEQDVLEFMTMLVCSLAYNEGITFFIDYDMTYKEFNSFDNEYNEKRKELGLSEDRTVFDNLIIYKFDSMLPIALSSIKKIISENPDFFVVLVLPECYRRITKEIEDLMLPFLLKKNYVRFVFFTAAKNHDINGKLARDFFTVYDAKELSNIFNYPRKFIDASDYSLDYDTLEKKYDKVYDSEELEEIFHENVDKSVDVLLENDPRTFKSTMDKGTSFEKHCAILLEHNGFTNVRTTKGSGDHGVDILAERFDVTFAIQCKCYDGMVGNGAVQEAFTGKAFYNCDIAVVLTNSDFTQQAIDEAKSIGVKLWGRDKLKEFEQNME
ncbi:restriction endonuclease [Butyrivibrio sp. MB2005]|uniref:restriction endonuclease n=1 Tax=Butyrivibrio sp. MB2005 TaxID=1280678 RepID=UPI000684FA17|nr:restriction endonuclease [Butyrivibrio sp. MB2005]